MLNTSWNFVQS